MGGAVEESDATNAPVTWRQNDIAIDLVTFLFLLWPLAANGAPFYSDDSSSYLRGGWFGFETALLILSQWWQSLAGGLSIAGPASAAGL